MPRVAHMIWMQGWNELPARMRPFFEHNRAWAEAQGWTLTLWDAHSIEALLQSAHVPGAWRAKYAAYAHLHQRVDLARYIILYLRGGMSVDADARVLADPLASPTILEALEAQLRRGHGGATLVSACHATPLESRVQTLGVHSRGINNAIILTTPRRAVWRAFINWLPSAPPRALLDEPAVAFARLFAAGRKFVDITCTAGPVMFALWWADAAAGGAAAVLDADILEPCGPSDCPLTERTVVKHEHAQSWLPPAFVSALELVRAHRGTFVAARTSVVVLMLLLLALAGVAALRSATRGAVRHPRRTAAATGGCDGATKRRSDGATERRHDVGAFNTTA